MFLVLCQVVVGSVCNAPQLAPAKGETILEVCGCLGVEAQLFLVVVTQTQVLFLQTQIQQEVLAVATPVLEPFQVGVRLAEELQFHLLELTDTEDKVARCDLVAERLTDLSNAEGQLFPGGALDVGKVYEDALCRLRTQIQFRLGILCNALIGLEHQIELADVGEVRLAAVWAGDLLFPDVVHHLLVGPAGRIGAVKVLDEVVGTVSGLTGLAVHQRIGETAQVTGCHPCLRIHDNGGIQSHVIRGFLDELFPPCTLDVVFQLYAQRTVVPGVSQTAVNFRTRVYKATGLTEVYDLIHALLFVGQHFWYSPLLAVRRFPDAAGAFEFACCFQQWYLLYCSGKRRKCQG